jgi:hypothetical protein
MEQGFVYFIFEKLREGVQSRAAMASNTMHLWKVERRVEMFEVSRIGRWWILYLYDIPRTDMRSFNHRLWKREEQNTYDIGNAILSTLNFGMEMRRETVARLKLKYAIVTETYALKTSNRASPSIFLEAGSL